MEIMIAGASGFIGKYLVNYLKAQGHRITVVSRYPTQQSLTRADQIISWQQLQTVETIPTPQLVINLAGESIQGYWSKSKKEKILNSRIEANRSLLEYCQRKGVKNYFAASAIGYYGDRKNELLTEQSTPGYDFLATTCQAIESFILQNSSNQRCCLLRTGIVLGKSGGFLKAIAPFRYLKFFPLFGKGENYFSTITLEEYCRAITFLIDHQEINGPVNLVSPTPLTMKEWLKTNRLMPLKLPSFLAKDILGEASILLLGGQRVIPQKLLEHGFKF